ncbi:MAG TPA: hypothetical protein VF980_18235 [Thermoanaerobaculia bacterium]
MREILIPFVPRVTSPEGAEYRIRIVGHERADGIWEGVIEFHRDDTRLVTGVETTQPDAESLEKWAGSLKTMYFEAALRRARRPGSRRSAAHAAQLPDHGV